MAKATKKGSKMLVDSIDRINVTSVSLEGKRIEIQDKLVEKQLEYFKVRDEVANRTHMAICIGMIKAFNNLTHVMTQLSHELLLVTTHTQTMPMLLPIMTHKQTTKMQKISLLAKISMNRGKFKLA
jgi:beta-xylosidase